MSLSDDLWWLGWDWNDRMTSVFVPAGRRVTLYEHGNFDGASLVLTSSVGDLRDRPGPGADGTWNDVVSSVRVD